MTAAAPARTRAQVRERVTDALRDGRVRAGAAAGPILLAAVAAAVSYALAYRLLGQPTPFFAPAAAWISLGFSRDRQVRRVAEMAIGVSLGVGLGELLGAVLGAGGWQVGVALAVAALLARLLDAAPLMTTQAGLQAIIIVALPVGVAGGSVGRWLDALVGGVVALVVAVLVPGRSWRRAGILAEGFLDEVAGVLALLAAGLRRGDVRRAADALASGRASDAVLQRWRDATAAGADAVRFSPVARRHRHEIEVLAQACTLADHAMRNSRVVTRRSLVAIEEHGPLPRLGDVVGRLAVAVAATGAGLRAREDLSGVRADLSRLAVELGPERFTGWRVQSLVVLLRSLLVDLLEITGMSYEDAKAELARGSGGGPQAVTT